MNRCSAPVTFASLDVAVDVAVVVVVVVGACCVAALFVDEDASSSVFRTASKCDPIASGYLNDSETINTRSKTNTIATYVPPRRTIDACAALRT